MYPDNESHLSSKGNSPDHQPASASSPTTADDECQHSGDEAPIADEGLPNTTNSSTMTCPECQYPGGSWLPPPHPSHHVYPCCPYNGGGMFCYPPPYFAPPPPAYGYPSFQAAPLRPPAYCNVNVTSSGMSVGGGTRQTQSNTSSVQENSDHALSPNTNCYHQFTYPYSPSLYNPNHTFLQSHFGLPVVLTSGQNSNTEGVRLRNSLCSNCSTEIISGVDDANADEITCVRRGAPLNITSFTDSMGRVWKCTGTKPHRKAVGSKSGKETADKPSETKRSNVTSRVTSPSVERRSTVSGRDDAVLPLRKKRTKLRLRKAMEETNICSKPSHCSPASKLGVGTKSTPTKRLQEGYAYTDAPTTSRPKPTRRLPPPKDEPTPNDPVKTKRTEPQNALPFHEVPCPKKTHAPPVDEPEDDRGNLEASQNVPVDDNTTVSAEIPAPKYVEVEPVERTDEKASCNDFLKRGTVVKDDDEFWSSSSSSSGTYDDSEAFDSFKLLADAGVSAEAVRQSRQRSRDRLFRRRVGGGSTKSEEAMKRRRRSASPRARVGDDRNNDLVLVDTSQLRITEETPKRFVVESKDNASASQKAMTITVQAEVSASRGGEMCPDVPPCQRPQWQAPPCPANEIHGTLVHHCNNPVRPPPPQPQVQGYHRQRHANTPLFAGETPPSRETDEYRRLPRRNLPTFGLATPWSQRNADRPREENRHHYVPPRPSTERLDDSRREPTNRTRRWHAQAAEPGSLSDSRRTDEMLRIQIPNSFPRYRPYEYGRGHVEDAAEGAAEDEGEGGGRHRNTIDINIFRGGAGVRRLGTVRRVVQCGSPRSRGEASVPPPPPDEDPEGGLDFYRRPRSAITVSKTNYFSPRNRKLEEEVQRIQNGANYDVGAPSAAGVVKGGEEEGPEYPGDGKDDRDDRREFQDSGKPDCDYEEETDDCKRDPDRHRAIEDEED